MRGIDPVREGDWEVLEQLAARSSAQMGAENFPVAFRVLPRRPRVQPRQRVFLRPLRRRRRRRGTGRSRRAARSRRVGRPRVARRPVGAACGRRAAAVVHPRSTARAVPRSHRGEPDGPDRDAATRPSTTCSATAGCPPRRWGASCCTSPVPRPTRNVADSDAVCAALQVLEHCQDVAEDARAGRVYLPRHRSPCRRR